MKPENRNAVQVRSQCKHLRRGKSDLMKDSPAFSYSSAPSPHLRKGPLLAPTSCFLAASWTTLKRNLSFSPNITHFGQRKGAKLLTNAAESVKRYLSRRLLFYIVFLFSAYNLNNFVTQLVIFFYRDGMYASFFPVKLSINYLDSSLWSIKNTYSEESRPCCH